MESSGQYIAIDALFEYIDNRIDRLEDSLEKYSDDVSIAIFELETMRELFYNAVVNTDRDGYDH